MGYRRNIPETRTLTAPELITFDIGSKVLSVSIFVPIGSGNCLYGFGGRAGNVLTPGNSITVTAIPVGDDVGVLDGSSLSIDWDASVAAASRSVIVGQLKAGECLDIE